MKKKKLIAISAMLATMTVATVAGGALAIADATEKPTYTLSSVFSVDKAELGVMQSGENYVTKFTLSDDGAVSFAHNLAYEWREGDSSQARGFKEKYLSFTFAFKTLNFKSVTIAMESESAWATKEDRTTNKLTFTKEEDKFYVQINDDETTKKQVVLTAEQKITMSFDKGGEFGEFAVLISGVKNTDDTDVGRVGVFRNIAGKYGEYVYDEQTPLKITADMGEDSTEKAEVLLYAINGQRFDEATEDKKVYDTAVPVLVINEEFSTFTLGTTISLNYTMVDVLQDTGLTKTMEYYHYNPDNVVTADDLDEFKEYKKTLTTSTIIYRMPYTYADDMGTSVKTTVFKKFGKEYVAIRFSLGDKTFTESSGEYAKAVYDLSWYTEDAVKVDERLRPSKLWYVAFDRSESGATYKYLETDSTTKTNKIVNTTDYEEKKSAFESALEKASKDVYAGTNSEVYFPSMEWLFDDDNGYRNLKYTISYRAPGSTSNSVKSDVAYNKLQLSIAKDGIYEFKVFATDVEKNAMQYYLDGELVNVTSDNIWDIEEIPYFTFSVKKQGLKVDDTKNTRRKDTSVLDKSYTMSSFTVVGATSLKSDYALYKVDTTEYNKTVTANKQLSVSDFTGVTYEQLANKLKETGFTLDTAKGDYFALYLKAYAHLVAEAKNGDAESILSTCFEKVGEYGDNINNPTDKYEKYEWNPDSRTFQAVEQGNFLILADYWEEATPASVRAAAYKMVVVETEKLTYTGETDWLKNNVASIVLFSIAGVLLIVIIILLLVKPSDETLEDLDSKAVKAKKVKEPKTKKSK